MATASDNHQTVAQNDPFYQYNIALQIMRLPPNLSTTVDTIEILCDQLLNSFMPSVAIWNNIAQRIPGTLLDYEGRYLRIYALKKSWSNHYRTVSIHSTGCSIARAPLCLMDSSDTRYLHLCMKTKSNNKLFTLVKDRTTFQVLFAWTIASESMAWNGSWTRLPLENDCQLQARWVGGGHHSKFELIRSK
ncbi:hypothetical protein BKA67DRAFT_536036 [Truncatella angustata]|uniref:Uncharacterized protein n=1 Tax=Truncatella angustata TaxID=152316 RepID=A0A9P8UM65_9PEZI|nr:uncharacterized protein BKA67DRAFT_536036 [Truncatella angustata]KAH6654734.1 hypothetical protein BKA67DRAFT_536036 [Truncatella angustata]